MTFPNILETLGTIIASFIYVIVMFKFIPFSGEASVIVMATSLMLGMISGGIFIAGFSAPDWYIVPATLSFQFQYIQILLWIINKYNLFAEVAL